MKQEINELTINGITYVPKSQVTQPASKDGLPYVVIRSRDSGCHAGYLKSKTGDSVVLIDSRRLWYWSGAATLSQLAMEGVKNPNKCKFPQPVTQIEVLGVCEIIQSTEEARKSIEGVIVWKK